MSDDQQPEGPGIRDLLSLGGMLIGCIVAGVAIGYVIDLRAGTSPVWVLVGTAAGILAAGIGFWLRVRQFLGRR